MQEPHNESADGKADNGKNRNDADQPDEARDDERDNEKGSLSLER
jgi:hypothetical protein